MTRVAVVGTLAFDLIAAVERFPDVNESARLRTVCDRFGGGAGTVALGLARLGCACAVIAVVGDDFTGSRYELDLIRKGVDVELLSRGRGATSRAFIFTRPDGSQVAFFLSGPTEPLRQPAGRIAFGYFGPGPIDQYASIMQSCDLVVFDPGQEVHYRDFRDVRSCLPYVTILTVNEYEAEALSRQGLGVDACFATGVEAIIVTRGARKTLLYSKGNPMTEVETLPAIPVEATGAGDAFRAGLLWALQRGSVLRDAVRVGNVMGAFAVEREGDAEAPVLSEVRGRFEHQFGPWPFAESLKGAQEVV